MLAAIQIVGLQVAVYVAWRMVESMDTTEDKTITKVTAALGLFATLGLQLTLLSLEFTA